MSTQNPNDKLTRLARLAALVRDNGVDVEAMTDAQLVQYLKENKIELAGPQKRFSAVLKKAQARRRLELAQTRRLEAVGRAKEMLSSGPIAVDAVRERVRSMIDKFRRHDPEQAQMYAREFERATQEDLQVLEEDLTLLEMDITEDGKSDKQNKG